MIRAVGKQEIDHIGHSWPAPLARSSVSRGTRITLPDAAKSILGATLTPEVDQRRNGGLFQTLESRMSTKRLTTIGSFAIFGTARYCQRYGWLAAMRVEHLPTQSILHSTPVAQSCLPNRRAVLQWALEHGSIWLSGNMPLERSDSSSFPLRRSAA